MFRPIRPSSGALQLSKLLYAVILRASKLFYLNPTKKCDTTKSKHMKYLDYDVLPVEAPMFHNELMVFLGAFLSLRNSY
jgi:hypothetical protein